MLHFSKAFESILNKYSSTSAIRSYTNAAGIGVVGGVPYVNTGSGAVALGVDRSKGTTYFVDADNGNDTTGDGLSWGKAFATMTPLDAILDHGDVIYLSGVLRQHWQAPAVQDVTIIGAANTPRQATSNGVANGGGATWLSPSSPTNTSALLTVGNASYTTESQGWSVQNIFFNNAATSMGAIRLLRGDGSGNDNGNDSSHFSAIGCKFTGTDSGIVADGGPSFVYLIDNEFFNFTGGTDSGVREGAATAVALPLQWVVKGNRFWNNVRHFILPCSSGVFEDNNFAVIGSSLTTTIALSLTGGKNNSVFGNMFNRPLNTSPNATLYVGGTNDVWSHNYGSDGIFYGVPDNS
jgi:hypothetical protein